MFCPRLITTSNNKKAMLRSEEALIVSDAKLCSAIMKRAGSVTNPQYPTDKTALGRRMTPTIRQK